MASAHFAGVRLDAHDVELIAAFWAQTLGWDARRLPTGEVLVNPPEPTSYPVIVCPGAGPKAAPNRIHFDLTTPSRNAMQDLLARARGLGATHADIGQSPDEPHMVLRDPEGNELCVIPPENGFLAHTGDIGAINCDGSRAVGYFWSEALGWPLVWDQNQETAIQAPTGGSKVTWSGPPLMSRHGRDRLRFEVSTTEPLPAAIRRLTSLGATIDEEISATEALMRDPDDREFHLVTR